MVHTYNRRFVRHIGWLLFGFDLLIGSAELVLNFINEASLTNQAPSTLSSTPSRLLRSSPSPLEGKSLSRRSAGAGDGVVPQLSGSFLIQKHFLQVTISFYPLLAVYI